MRTYPKKCKMRECAMHTTHTRAGDSGAGWPRRRGGGALAVVCRKTERECENAKGAGARRRVFAMGAVPGNMERPGLPRQGRAHGGDWA